MPIPRILSELYEASLKNRFRVTQLVNEAPEAPAADILKTDPEEAALVRKIQSRIAYRLSALEQPLLFLFWWCMHVCINNGRLSTKAAAIR